MKQVYTLLFLRFASNGENEAAVRVVIRCCVNWPAYSRVIIVILCVLYRMLIIIMTSTSAWWFTHSRFWYSIYSSASLPLPLNSLKHTNQSQCRYKYKLTDAFFLCIVNTLLSALLSKLFISYQAQHFTSCLFSSFNVMNGSSSRNDCNLHSHGLTGDLVSAPPNPEVAIFTPRIAPRILHDPVLLSRGLISSIAHYQHHMVGNLAWKGKKENIKWIRIGISSRRLHFNLLPLGIHWCQWWLLKTLNSNRTKATNIVPPVRAH